MAGLEDAVAARGVAVIGAGPVGQTTSLLLARRGVPVLLLDGRSERDPIGSKAICQQRDVLDVWEFAGAGRAITAEGLTWRTARTFHRDRELFAEHLPDAGMSEFPPFVNISQARVEEILDERIARQPLIDVRWDHEVTGLDQDSTGVTIHCDGERDVRAAHVVACAGARAEVLRRALGVDFGGRSFDDRFLICDIRAELPDWADERRFYFDPAWNPGRQVLIHPCPGGTCRIDWQVPEDYDLAAEQASGDLEARVRAIIGDIDHEIVWASVYRFHSRVVDRMRVGRVLLAGDCAHLYAPFGARGLNSGVGDADNAAWKLAWVVRGWAGDELLESYHAERHAAAQENLAVTTATMDFLVPHDEEGRRRREAVLTGAASDRELRAQVDSGRLAEPFWYVASSLTTADDTRPFAGRPERATVPSPGPGILAPDAAVSVTGCTRLRELARTGFLVLAAPAADVTGARALLTAWAEGEEAAGDRVGPVRVLGVDEVDPTGSVAAELGMRSGELWLLRPDAYVAAVITDPRDLGPALRRACGRVGVSVR